MNERDLFIAALQKRDTGQRREYLREACGPDPALLERVEGLLQVYEDADSFLESPASAPTLLVESPRPVEAPGESIGPYRLMEQIGEGGMGVVYVAEQSAPVRRRVALKVIKPGMDTKQVIARFEAERQALAMMDHPNIAKVHDAGATDSGRPYFVMELVRGLPITDYCDREQLSIPERLDLFVLVCRAVQHAHQKGIIHRDLKPSNVLVTVIDGAAVPKVIDFGIAKATGPALTDGTVYTGFHQLVGTPLYMSPEQADLSGVDVDTRSDIYSLGVLLYELLTGTTPFDAETLGKAAFDELRRILREVEPPTPSTRLGSLGQTLSTVSACRKADPRRLGPSMRSELDWVVMKALEKDRRRRYETANDFAADVMRYLTDQPVEACPPSAWYRSAKFARRNRTALTTAGLVALALLSGVSFSGWQAIRATRSERRTAEALATAERRSTQARRAVDEMYTEVAEKWLARDGQLTPLQKQFLEKALAFYEEFAAEQGTGPDARHEVAKAAERVGEIRQDLGLFDRALAAYNQGVETYMGLLAQFPDRDAYRRGLAQAENNRGTVLLGLGRLNEAERAVQNAIELRDELVTQGTASAADRRGLATSLNVLGSILGSAGRRTDQNQAMRRGLDIKEKLVADFPGDPDYRSDLARALNNLGVARAQMGKAAEAEVLCRRALELRTRLAADFPTNLEHQFDLALCHHNLGRFLAETNRHTEALSELEQARDVEQSLSISRPDWPHYRWALVETQVAVGDELASLGRFREAEEVTRKATEGAETLLARFPEVSLDNRRVGAQAIGCLGLRLAENGKPVEARQAMERAFEELQKLVAGNPGRWEFRSHLGEHCSRMAEHYAAHPAPEHRDPARALELARKAVELRPRNAASWKILGLAEYRAGNWGPAIKSIEKSLELLGKPGDPYHWTILALAHARRGEPDKSRKWFAKLPPYPERGKLADMPRSLYDEAAALQDVGKPNHPAGARPEVGADPTLN